MDLIDRLYAKVLENEIPSTNEYFLAGTPTAPLALVVVYLYLVFHAAPKFMARRQPYTLKSFLQWYNVLQIVLNGYVFAQSARLHFSGSYGFVDCQRAVGAATPRGREELNVCYLFYMLKLIDLSETVVYCLRKKQTQISFLHVYHHVTTFLLCYLGVKIMPGAGMLVFTATNSFVHCIMYTYYLLSTYSSLQQRLLPFKKWLTTLQMVQFTFFLYLLSVNFNRETCAMFRWICYILIPDVAFIFYLFGKFYVNTYLQKNKNKTK